MRLIDADELKEKLLKMQNDIVNQNLARGSTKNDAWIFSYLLILDEYIKKLDEMPSVTPGCDADDILDAYGKGYSKGYIDGSYNTLKEMWKEQKIENNEVTKDELWDKVIQNLKTLDAGLIVTMAEELRTDVIHGTIKQEDKSDMWTLVDDLGYYTIKGQTIKYLPEYQELTTLMKKVF